MCSFIALHVWAYGAGEAGAQVAARVHLPAARSYTCLAARAPLDLSGARWRGVDLEEAALGGQAKPVHLASSFVALAALRLCSSARCVCSF